MFEKCFSLFLIFLIFLNIFSFNLVKANGNSIKESQVEIVKDMIFDLKTSKKQIPKNFISDIKKLKQEKVIGNKLFYSIRNLEELEFVANGMNTGDDDFLNSNYILNFNDKIVDLGCNIENIKLEKEFLPNGKEFNLKVSGNIDKKWIPMGTGEKFLTNLSKFSVFKGEFDGNGHVIKNMLVYADDQKDNYYNEGNVYAGFFGHIESDKANITNLTIEDSMVIAKNSRKRDYATGNGVCYAGAMVGSFDKHSDGKFENLNVINCKVIGFCDPEISHNARVGGCIGSLIASNGRYDDQVFIPCDLDIKNCKTENTEVIGTGQSGGLFGTFGGYDEKTLIPFEPFKEFERKDPDPYNDEGFGIASANIDLHHCKTNNCKISSSTQGGGLVGGFVCLKNFNANFLESYNTKVYASGQAGGLIGAFGCGCKPYDKISNRVELIGDFVCDACLIDSGEIATLGNWGYGGFTAGFGCNGKVIVSGLTYHSKGACALCFGFGCVGDVIISNCKSDESLLDTFSSGFGCAGKVHLTDIKTRTGICCGFGCVEGIKIVNCDSEEGVLFGHQTKSGNSGFGCFNGGILLSGNKTKNGICGGFGCGNGGISISNCTSEIGSLMYGSSYTGFGGNGSIYLSNNKTKNGICGGLACNKSIEIIGCTSEESSLLNGDCRTGLGCGDGGIKLIDNKTKNGICGSLGCSGDILINGCTSETSLFENKYGGGLNGFGTSRNISFLDDQGNNTNSFKKNICEGGFGIGENGKKDLIFKGFDCESLFDIRIENYNSGYSYSNTSGLGCQCNVKFIDNKFKSGICGGIGAGSNLSIENCESDDVLFLGDYHHKRDNRIGGAGASRVINIKNSKFKNCLCSSLASGESIYISGCESDNVLFPANTRSANSNWPRLGIGSKEITLENNKVKNFLCQGMGGQKINIINCESIGDYNLYEGIYPHGGIIGEMGANEIYFKDCTHRGNIKINIDNLEANAINKNRIQGTAAGIVSELGAKKITLENCNHEGDIKGLGETGGLVSKIGAENLSFDNCNVKAKVRSLENLAGGLIGSEGNKEPMDIKNCFFNGEVISDASIAGGLIALGDNVKLNKCYSKGQVSGRGRVGGLIGECMFTDIENCYALCDLDIYQSYDELKDIYVGGLIGTDRDTRWGFRSDLPQLPIPGKPDQFEEPGSWNGPCATGSSIEINDCYFIGNINAETSPDFLTYSGGLVGAFKSNDSQIKIKNSYAASKNIGDGNPSFSGGIIGYSQTKPLLNKIYAYNTDKINSEAVSNSPELSEGSKFNTIEMTGISPNIFDDLETRAPENVKFTTYDEKWEYKEDKYEKSAREHYYDRYCSYPILKNTNENPNEILYEKYKDIDLQDPDTKVWVISEGPYPLDSKLFVNAMDTENELKTVSNLWDDVHELKARYSSFYDIHLEHGNGKKYQPISPVKIRIPIPSHFDKAKLESFKLEGGPDKTFENEVILNINGIEYLEFVTDHFSYYGISDESDKYNYFPYSPSNPQTGIKLPIALFIEGIFLLTFFGIFNKNKRYKKNID